MDQDKLLDIYYKHYTDTNELSRTTQRRRNKYFVVLCILEAISFMLFKNPNFICSLLNDVISKEIETTIIFSQGILQTMIWFCITYSFIRYIQDMLYIERQYCYIESLEKNISVIMGNNSIFKRESDNYLSDYPIVLNLIDVFYKTLCPLFFTAINIMHITYEMHTRTSLFMLILDSILCLTIFILTWFYFFEIHVTTTKWFKRKLQK